LSDSDLRYTFTCPSCRGNFSILLDRIPPIQARFRCPHCEKPMDFPSRDEARVYARLQAETAAATPPADEPAAAAPAPPEPAPVQVRAPVWKPPVPGSLPPEGDPASVNQRFRVEKQGFETDEFDRRAIRNLIRTGEVGEEDFVSVDSAQPVPAGQVPFLRSLFKLRATSTVTPPARCRKHTDLVAFYKCQDTARPLCEECAPERKFGNTVARVCSHCGGNAVELVAPAAEA
jgi:predicted Zn finger-like uncharacterized protein